MSVYKERVFDILVQECGAYEDLRAEFLAHWPECNEFRFSGLLGFGGKVWADGRVSCYPEDSTPKRRSMIDRAERRIALLKWECKS